MGLERLGSGIALGQMAVVKQQGLQHSMFGVQASPFKEMEKIPGLVCLDCFICSCC